MGPQTALFQFHSLLPFNTAFYVQMSDPALFLKWKRHSRRGTDANVNNCFHICALTTITSQTLCLHGTASSTFNSAQIPDAPISDLILNSIFWSGAIRLTFLWALPLCVRDAVGLGRCWWVPRWISSLHSRRCSVLFALSALFFFLSPL